MKLQRLLILFTLHFSFTASAQQDPMYSMYTQDKMLVNPAFVGSSNWVVGTLKYRNNAPAFKNQYTTQTFNLHGPIQSKHIGLGLKLVNDKRSVLTNFNLAVVASYHLNLAGGKLSFGIEGGVYNRKINYDQLVTSQKNDQTLNLYRVSSTTPDLSFGFYYQKKQFYVGYSRFHLLMARFDKKEIQNSGSFIHAHDYIIIGKVIDLDKKWAMEPSALLKHQAKSGFQLDASLLICYDSKISAGLQYRTGSALLSMLKYNITQNLKISYSFDYSLSKFSQLSSGAHEIIISYGIQLPPPPIKKEIHPRYYF
jgi:type IX secretion system PorP/SprF family membrane protein